ncbi:MAG: DUF3617 family protein [Acidobacteriota bacterium]
MTNRFHTISRLCSAALLSGATAVVFAQTAPTLDVRSGLWELSLTSSIDLGGEPPMDTSKMTREQKAKLKEALKTMAQPHSEVQRKCVTKESLVESLVPNPDPACIESVATNTKTRFQVQRTCGGGRPGATELRVEAASPRNLKGTIKALTSKDGKQQTMKIAFTGKWVAAACGAVK